MARPKGAGLDDWLIGIAIAVLIFTPLIGGNWWWLPIVAAVIILAFVLVHRRTSLANV